MTFYWAVSDFSIIIFVFEFHFIIFLLKLHKFPGFKIKFFFETNPYFENSELVKEYQLDSKGDPTSVSTDIKWKEGYDLTARAAQRAAVAKGAQRKRKLETRTFFTWYTDNEDPSNDDVGEIIKDDLW